MKFLFDKPNNLSLWAAAAGVITCAWLITDRMAEAAAAKAELKFVDRLPVALKPLADEIGGLREDIKRLGLDKIGAQISAIPEATAALFDCHAKTQSAQSALDVAKDRENRRIHEFPNGTISLWVWECRSADARKESLVIGANATLDSDEKWAARCSLDQVDEAYEEARKRASDAVACIEAIERTWATTPPAPQSKTSLGTIKAQAGDILKTVKDAKKKTDAIRKMI